MKQLTAIAAVLGILWLIWPGAAGADYLVADLSKRRIDITLGFAGAEVLLFGATDGGGDVIVVVRGPDQQAVVRHKDRVAGIWINREWMRFDNAPAFYFVATSRPLEAIASEATLSGVGVGLENIGMTPASSSDGGDAAAFRAALIHAKEREGLYGTGPGQVAFIGGRLFRTTVSFPATVETGAYTVEVLLVRNGQVESAQRWPLFITKVGLSAAVFDHAHDRPAVYGLVAVLIAVMAGWLGAIGLRNI
jgi:uncharacterized protein (TIGR02186 family)